MIKKINLYNFRLFQNQEIRLGKNITVISGHNATGKSTILALLGHCAELKGKYGLTIFNKRFRTEFREIFSISKEKDSVISKAIGIEICEKSNYNHTIECFDCRTTWQETERSRKIQNTNTRTPKKEKRYRIIPKRIDANGKKSEKKLNLPSLYLGLSRLYPIGESEKTKQGYLLSNLPQADKDYISNFYYSVMLQNQKSEPIIGINNISISETSKKRGIGITTPNYTFECNSAGQDNLGQIATAMLSYKKLKEHMDNDWNGGLLLIDELDATLHPIAQNKLFDLLLSESEKLDLQICFTTHSLSLLEHISNIIKNNNKDGNNSVELCYITKANMQLQFFQNLSYNAIMYDLTMTLHKENKEKILVYTEDAEAKWFASILLKPYLEKIEIIDFSKGCNEIINLMKIDQHFRYDVIIMLDGDAETQVKHLDSNTNPIHNIICLPAYKKSPELLIYELLFNDPTKLQKCWDINEGLTCANIRQNYPLTVNDNKKERIIYKKWFQKIHNDAPSFLESVVKEFITDIDKGVYDEFINKFINTYNIIAHKKNIPIIKSQNI